MRKQLREVWEFMKLDWSETNVPPGPVGIGRFEPLIVLAALLLVATLLGVVQWWL